MQFIIAREALLKPLQTVIGVVERQQTMPILGNALLHIHNNQLTVTCTDLEIELVSNVTLDNIYENKKITIPARKLLDICRVLPEKSSITFNIEDNKVIICAAKNRFSLPTLPPNSFPNVEWENEQKLLNFSISQDQLYTLLGNTYFAMAQQDVRYYLNGLLLDCAGNTICAVATNGHRLAFNEIDAISTKLTNDTNTRVIIPHKSVTELLRLLKSHDEDTPIQAEISTNHIRFSSPEFTCTSSLIEGKYPDYHKAIPKEGERQILIESNTFKQALNRVAILANDVSRGIQLHFQPGLVHIKTHSPDQSAEEEVPLDYKDDPFTVSFNIDYLMDLFSHVDSEQFLLSVKDGNSSILFHGINEQDKYLYVIMPLRI